MKTQFTQWKTKNLNEAEAARLGKLTGKKMNGLFRTGSGLTQLEQSEYEDLARRANQFFQSQMEE